MKKTAKVLAPATVANIGCGYDTIGFALEGIYEEIMVTRRDDELLTISKIEGANLPTKAHENVSTIAAKALLDHQRIKMGFDFRIKKHFLPSSGLGSSASSAAGAVYAVNQLLPKPLSTAALLPFALEGEAFASKSYHADNVAPALLGGCICMRSYDPLDYFSVPIAGELEVLIARPNVEIKTLEAKGILPKQIGIPVARNQWGNLASLIHALHIKDWNRLANSIEDFIAEPVRKSLIPGYDQMKAIANEHGCVGFNISGSGPSVFMLFTNKTEMKKSRYDIQKMNDEQNITCDFFESKMSNQGCRLMEDEI